MIGSGISVAYALAQPWSRVMKINPAASQVASGAQAKTPPAQAARELLSTQTDLPKQPFGKLVSQIAKGEETPPPVSG